MEFDLLYPSVGSLNHSCNKIDAATLVTRCIRTTERDRLSATAVNLQREARVLPITDKSHTRERDVTEEEERIRISNSRG